MIKKRINSFKYALNGLKVIILTQANFKIHILAALLAVSLSAYLGINSIEWIAIIISICFVMTAEALNTSLEFCCDAITENQNSKIGKAKDIGAAAVLIAAISSIIVAFIIFLPKIITLLLKTEF